MKTRIRLALAGAALSLLLAVWASGCTTGRDEVDQGAIRTVLGYEVTGDDAIRQINDLFLAEPAGPVAYCCGNASCSCTDLGDCINLWFSANCADIAGPDIQGGTCEKKGDKACTNDDCSCPD